MIESMLPELSLPEEDRIICLRDVEESLKSRINGIDAWLSEVGNFCKTEQKHCEEGTVERAYWHHGYMMALRDALDLLKRNSKALC
jgi:hypothetical protein